MPTGYFKWLKILFLILLFCRFKPKSDWFAHLSRSCKIMLTAPYSSIVIMARETAKNKTKQASNGPLVQESLYQKKKKVCHTVKTLCCSPWYCFIPFYSTWLIFFFHFQQSILNWIKYSADKVSKVCLWRTDPFLLQDKLYCAKVKGELRSG